MLPRSCLEDMAWRHSSTTEIGEYQVAAGGWGRAGRPVGLSQSVTVTRQNRVLLLQIETNGIGGAELSKSVTLKPVLDVWLLQIEINAQDNPLNLDL